MRRATATTVALCVLALPIAACGGDDPSAATTATVAAASFPTTIENCGTKADVFQQPRKILAVSTAAQKLIYGAGGASFVIGRAGEDAGPAPAPVVAAMKNAELLPPDTLSKEAIIGTGADTVISYGIETKGLPAAKISNITISAGCGVFVGKSKGPVTFDTIYADLEQFGRLFGTEQQAQDTVADLKRRVAAVETDTAGAADTTAAAGYFFGTALSTNGSPSIQNAWMRALGVENVFADVPKEFVEGNTEELVKRDPDLFILGYGYDGKETFAQAKRKFLAIPGISDTKAGRSDRIIGVPASESEPDPYAVAGLERIAREMRAGTG